MTLNIILIVVGGLFFGYGLFLAISGKYDKKREQTYTVESLIKTAKLEGIFDMVTALGIVFAGLGYDGKILSNTIYYIGFVVAIVSIIVDTFVETKFLVKIEQPKEENK